MSKLDDLAAWRYFVTFAKTGTLSAAASALGVDVSNLSRAIAGLEKALGCDLIRLVRWSSRKRANWFSNA